ncbi:MAG: hypothetical protein LUQ65_03575 [Candidatus Helarchaeota archaeon]|nr:hypothetical protein [Candidatus Helarchaeota archaeon]
MIYNIFFIHKEHGLNLLWHSFSGSKLDADLVSGFISALISFINSLRPPTGDEKLKKDNLIRTVDRGDFKILVESGEYILGILFVNMEKIELRVKLREIINQFEASFDLKAWTGKIEHEQFEAFKEVIFKKFANEIIQVSDVPLLNPKMEDFLATHDELDLLGEHSLSVGLIELLLRIDGTSDIQEIANRLESPVEEVIEKVGYLFESGFVTIESPVNEPDIFVLTPEAMAIFHPNTYEQETMLNLFGQEGINVLFSVDGSRSVQGIQRKTNISIDKIKEVLRFCYKERLVKQVRLHPLIQKSFNLNEFAKDGEENELFQKIAGLCDGDHSLREIAKHLKVSVEVVTTFLVTMGDFIQWIKK